MLLIHPPVSKPCEPPAGIARLAGALREHGISCTVIDANVEGLHFLLDSQRVREGADIWGHDPISSEIGIVSPDMKMVLKARGRDRAGNTWTKRAVHNLLRHLHSLRTWPLYGHADRYRRAVADINRVLAGASSRVSVTVGLADYEDAALSSLKSADLLQAAAHPEKNPFYPYFSERLAAILNDQDPELIGISVNYLSQALCAFAMIGFLRSLLPQGKIVLGGGLVTSWLRQNQRHNPCAGNLADVMTDSGADLLLHPQWQGCFAGLVDHLVAGPGEEVLLSLIKKDSHQTPSDGDSKDLSHSDFAVLSGSSISNVPCPDYRSFPWELYLSPGPILPYSASTGCYWRRCRFCPETAEGNPYRPLPVKKVLSDLERLKKETNPVLIHFLDNAVSPALLAALAEQRNRVPWYGFVRITEQMANPAFCRRLHDAGCVMLKLGLESGDQGVLDALEKGIDLKTASLVLRNLKEAGIGTYVYLLFGTPAEDRTAARRTMEYVVENSSSIDFLNVAIFNMPVFAAAADDLVTRPFSTGDLSLYTDFEHPQGWNRREVRSFVDGELKRNPVIAEILKRTPPVFTSNHAPLTLPSRVFLPLHC
ncbi:MAG: radical SAM protein [Deltaproteobacteria bacterium]|nr:radical SAM protein [Deltaproteobacteria bacterium]